MTRNEKRRWPWLLGQSRVKDLEHRDVDSLSTASCRYCILRNWNRIGKQVRQLVDKMGQPLSMKREYRRLRTQDELEVSFTSRGGESCKPNCVHQLLQN